jgi:two-component system sensor kinase FixL
MARKPSAAETLPDALAFASVMLRTRDGTIRQWSPALTRLYGYSTAEVLGRKAQELLRTDYSGRHAQIRSEIDARGEWSGDVINRRKDGTKIVAAVHCARIPDEDLVVETHVLAGRRNPESDYYAAIVESSDDAIFATTLEGLVTSWNRAAEAMFQYSADDMIGFSVEKLLPLDRRREEEIILKEVGLGHKITHYETLRLREDGAEIATSLTVSPIRAADGHIIGASRIARDITERRNVEERFQQMQSELAHMGRLNEMGQMASALAHELNQPLTATNNYIAAARRNLEAPAPQIERALDALSKAGAQVLRAGEIIRRLRGFLSKTGPETQAEIVERLIEDTAALAHIDAKFRDIALKFDFETSNAKVLLDRVQFQQVLLNLLRNAFEAAECQPKPEVTIATRTKGNNVEISVSDSGPGLAPEIAENLFQPFVTTKQGGMGVGLSICRSIVEGFGGKIWYQPAPGGGAQFLFTVPLEPA